MRQIWRASTSVVRWRLHGFGAIITAMPGLLDERSTYFDNAATSYPKPESVYTAMDDFARRIGGSVGRSSHRRACEASVVADGARDSLAALLGAPSPSCVCFAANATDALNTAIYGLASPGCNIVTSSVEHNSVRRPLADLRDRCGCSVTVIEADRRGLWNPNDVIAAIHADTALVALGWAGNVTGALQELEPVAQHCARLRVSLVIDAAQSCGAHPVQASRLGAAALAFTGHKALLGPQGTGGLIVDPELAPRIQPLRRGGTGIESDSEHPPRELPARLEAGTLNGHGIAGLRAGTEHLLRLGMDAVRAREMALWQRLRDGLRELPHVHVHGPDRQDQAVAIVSVTVDGMEPSDVGVMLDVHYGILTRTGLHCAPGAHKAIGTWPAGTVRFSIGHATTEAEVDEALSALERVCERKQRPTSRSLGERE